MMTTWSNLTIEKSAVLSEVAKTTSYSGATMTDDEHAIDRIPTTDENEELLSRFWGEAKSVALERLKPFISAVTTTLADDFKVTLELSSSFDVNLKGSIEQSLFSFFVLYIVEKWFGFVNKKEVGINEKGAQVMMNDVMSKIYYKKKPTRITPV